MKHKYLIFKTIPLILISIILLTGCGLQDEITSGISESIGTQIKESLTQNTSKQNTSTSNEKLESSNITKETIVEEDVYLSQTIDTTQYYYNQLSEDAQNIYNQMYTAVETMTPTTMLDIPESISENDLGIIFRSVRYDHPEIYWIQSFKYRVYEEEDQQKSIEFAPLYLFTSEEKQTEDKNLEAWLENYNAFRHQHLQQQQTNELPVINQTEQLICDYISSTTSYNLQSENNQSLISVVHGESVCMGYTKAFKYLCDLESIPCIIVEGRMRSSNEKHSWNMVYLNTQNNKSTQSQWFVVDVTNSRKYHTDKNYQDIFNINKELANKIYESIPIKSGDIELTYPAVSNQTIYDWYTVNGLFISKENNIDTNLELVYSLLSTNDNKLRIRTDSEELTNIINSTAFRKELIEKLQVTELEIIIDSTYNIIEIRW